MNFFVNDKSDMFFFTERELVNKTTPTPVV